MLNSEENDEFGFVNIPSKEDFFFVLTNSNIYVLTGRKVLPFILINEQNSISKTYKSIEIDWILPEDQKNVKKSGIEDMGDL